MPLKDGFVIRSGSGGLVLWCGSEREYLGDRSADKTCRVGARYDVVAFFLFSDVC